MCMPCSKLKQLHLNCVYILPHKKSRLAHMDELANSSCHVSVNVTCFILKQTSSKRRSSVQFPIFTLAR